MTETELAAPAVKPRKPRKKKETSVGSIADQAKVINTVEDLPELCVPEEVAQLFRVQRAQVMKWLREKDPAERKLPQAFKIMGNRWRIPKEDVIALLRKMYGANSEGSQ